MIRNLSLCVCLGLGLALALAGTAAADGTCPVSNKGSTFLDDVVKAMKGKSCGEAAQIAQTCALGASGDVATVSAAVTICKADFAKTKSDGPLFTTLSKRCETKFAKQDGTMYRSAAAFCQLDVAVLLSQLNSSPQ